MFNGIIENIGKIKDCLSKNDSQKILINIDNLSNKIKKGDSVAVNGTCLTIDEINSTTYGFTVSHEKSNLTSLHLLKKDSLFLEYQKLSKLN